MCRDDPVVLGRSEHYAAALLASVPPELLDTAAFVQCFRLTVDVFFFVFDDFVAFFALETFCLFAGIGDGCRALASRLLKESSR